MAGKIRSWLESLRPNPYGRKPSVVLLNGLAEQAETWFRNHGYWRRYFDVWMPNLLVYDGEVLQQRIADDQPIDIDYLVGQLHRFLQEFVQTPPYHLVASSLGGKIAVEYAVRYPAQVSRMVLLAPSGMGDDEQLPIVAGVRRSNIDTMIDSVFCDRNCADSRLVPYFQRQFANRRWRTGFLRTIRGTMHHTVRDRLPLVGHPTLIVSGREDRIVDPQEACRAAAELPNGHFLLVPNCGHAPHLEKAWSINRVVLHFLTHPQPSPNPPLTQLLLAKPSPVI